MFGLTQHTPVTTSLTVLSAASFAGFGQPAHADRNNRLYQGQGASKRDVNQWQANSDVWDDGDDELKIASDQRKPDNLSAYSIPNDNNKRATQSDTDFPAVMELSSLDGGNGFEVDGISSSDYSGNSVSGAGDVNGDGYADIIIGAPFADPHGLRSAGESYVVFGKASGFGVVELSNLDGENGFQLNGISSGDQSGRSVSGAGDVNADGYDDIVIGARYANPNGIGEAGESYVVYGKPSFFSLLELSSLDGHNGFQLNGISQYDHSGWSLSGAGDVNADGYDDIIIGAYGASPNGITSAGESYVVYGKPSFFSPLELSSLDGHNGFQLNGISQNDWLGAGVSGAGDVNGDGYSDMVIGAPYGSPHGIQSAGESYVVYGRLFTFSPLELSSLDGVNGFQLNGISQNDFSGYSVGGAGDVNGDGYADIIIGAEYASPHGITFAGESYVVYGASSVPNSLELSSLDGVNGFQLSGISQNDFSGYSVSGAGDVNGDGYADVIIGAQAASPHGISSAGESYIVYGNSSFFGSVELSSLDGINGIQINGISLGDRSGYSVSGASDVNGDGYADIIIGADGANPHGIGNAGESYVIFGIGNALPPTPSPASIPSYPDSINVSDLNGQTGSVLAGATNQALMGNSVNVAGDVNNDGAADVIIGARGAGAGYVIFGNRDDFPSHTNVTKLTGEHGFNLVGASYEREFATAVGGGGDVNQDGVSDVLVGSPYAFDAMNIQTGKAYVVYGSRGDFSDTVNVTQLDGCNGFALEGESYSARLGYSVSDVGDVNHDGLSDFIVSAPYASVESQTQVGKAYVVFGDYAGYPSVFNVTTLNGTNGFTLTGENPFDHFGEALSSIGDINGDGITDIAVGAPEATANNQFQAGKVYVVFGSRNGFSSVMPMGSLNVTNGFCIEGAQAFDHFGASISSGELNQDGIDDLIIGAPNGKNSQGVASGKVYVLFSQRGGLDLQYNNVSSLVPDNGFVLDGNEVGDGAGMSVSGIGDFNVDGVNDIVVGAPQARVNNAIRAGKGYVVFGRYGGYPSDIALSSLDGNTGFTVEGTDFGDNLGSSVSSAGDINWDGTPDVLLGAPGTDNGGTGYTALVYGGVSLFSDARQGQSLRSQNTHTPNQLLTAANDVAPVVAEVPAFV